MDEDTFTFTYETISANDRINLPWLIKKADVAKQQPIDPNYVAVPAELWERIVRCAGG